jgi:LacI family gluconate utilization system Gnt-I transcriptional repressor
MNEGGGRQPERDGRAALSVTMAHVASMAGVTKMTVSRALRQPERVRPETRARIEQAIAQAGYIPNRTAGSLTAGSSSLVAAIVPTLRHSLFADTIEGLSAVLAEAGIDLIVASSGYRGDVEESQIRSMLQRRPDALVLTGLTHTPQARALLRSTGIPVVETWESTDEPIEMAVGYSNREAARAMTARLAAAGYRHIVFVNGPSGMNERARHRAEGYREALADAGLEPAPVEIARDVGVIRMETGARVLRKIMTACPQTDAVFFTSDVYAVGAVAAARALGIAVPDRLGIAGFHDLDLGRIVTPALTTVHVPALEIGRTSARLILARLAGEPLREPRRELPFRLIQRDSTRPPSSAR